MRGDLKRSCIVIFISYQLGLTATERTVMQGAWPFEIQSSPNYEISLPLQELSRIY